MPRLVECVPNVSEGRDRTVVDAIANAIANVAGVQLLDVDAGADTNRTVYTLVGSPEAVSEAALRAAHKAAELIDMSCHRGAHPRIGALDVCPIVPVAGVTMDECVETARTVGRRLGEELQIPIYFYEHAATRPERRSLANIRAGEYEGLERKLTDPDWAPDCGPVTFNRRLGATVVGAREFLIAYNVSLNTRDRRLANEIALNIRERGRPIRVNQGRPLVDEHGTQVKSAGRLKAVRAIGWYIEQYRQAQVSINLLDYNTTPLHQVFETVREEADQLGLIVTGSELVGMTPLQPLVEAGRFYLKKQRKSPGAPERELVETAIRSLGLDQLAPFDTEKKIIEYAVRAPAPLMSLAVNRFVDEVSTDSPAPGGGSVAALAGSLAAALAAMVSNLTVGRAGYEGVWVALSTLAERAQDVKSALARAVDDDTHAFNRVIDATRMARSTPEQQRTREAALEEAYKGATRMPLETARLCLQALELVGEAAATANTNLVSDAGVAALVARAGVDGAVLNVLTNLGFILDEEFKQSCRRESERLCERAERGCQEVLTRVRASFS